MKKLYTIKDGLVEELKGKDLDKINSIISEERMTLREVKKQYPDKYKILMKFLKANT